METYDTARADIQPLRARILREAIAAAVDAKPKPSSKPPSRPPKWKWKAPLQGQGRFDSNKGMEAKPYKVSAVKAETSTVLDGGTRAPVKDTNPSNCVTGTYGQPYKNILIDDPHTHKRPRPSDDIWSSITPPSLKRRSFGPSREMAPKLEQGPDLIQQELENLTRDHHIPVTQPSTRPISREQLLSEVKGIYAGLVMVEKKCIEIDQQQDRVNTKLSNEQWQALIALHRTLLHEHHDFFVATQHPAASNDLRQIARKYAMPARMWKYGIHGFLDLLHHKFPDSREHLLPFVYSTFSFMTLLKTSVPSMHEEWDEIIESLTEYTDFIERLQAKHESDDHNSAMGNVHPWIDDFGQDDSSNGLEFGEWYFGSHSYRDDLGYDMLQTHDQSQAEPTELRTPIILAMSGWLYYGQCIARSFNTYCKVLKVMVLTALFVN